MLGGASTALFAPLSYGVMAQRVPTRSSPARSAGNQAAVLFRRFIAPRLLVGILLIARAASGRYASSHAACLMGKYSVAGSEADQLSLDSVDRRTTDTGIDVIQEIGRG